MSGTNNEESWNIKTTIDELLSIPRFLGAFPFNRNNEFVSRRLIILFITSLVHLCNSAMWFSMNLSFVMIISLRLSIVLVNLTPCINIAWLWSKTSLLKEFNHKLDLVGKYFRGVGVQFNLRFKWIYKYLSFVFILNLAVMFVSVTKKIPFVFFIQLTCVYILIYSNYDQIFSFYTVLSYSFSRLKYVDDNREIIKNKEILSSLCKTVEELFSLQIVYLMLISFIDNVYVTFCIFKEGNMYPLIVYWFSFITSFYPLIRMTISVNNVIVQAREIDKLLYKRSLANPDDKLLEFHMIAKRNFTFTAFGFFQINNTLIGSMIGAGTTYLVILLQYGEDEKN